MAALLGEFLCAVDNKNRVRVPVALLRQLPAAMQKGFVINRGFEKCIVMYPLNEWEQVAAKVNKLNTFKKENREFKRVFLRGATQIELDNAERMLLPRPLMDYAGISKEIIMVANGKVIEMWNPENYEALMNVDSDAFADLAEKVMGDDDENQES